MLSLEKLDAHYDKVKVIRNVELHVYEKEIVTIVGGNGAGKSTLLRVISGLKRPSAGVIKFLDERIDTISPHRIVESGIIHVPEGRKIFPSLTVFEHLQLGSYIKRAKLKRKETLQEIFELFPVLKERKNQLGGTLSGGNNRCSQSPEVLWHFHEF